MESQINIQIVHGGFIFSSPSDDGMYKTEVFTSQGKLMKAIRLSIEANSLIGKSKDETAADKNDE